MGKADNAVTLDQILGHLKKIAAVVSLPVNADFEGGYAREPQGVAANVDARHAMDAVLWHRGLELNQDLPIHIGRASHYTTAGITRVSMGRGMAQ